MPPCHRPGAVVFLVLAMGMASGPARGAVEPAEVEKAIRGGVAYLYAEQQRDGRWIDKEEKHLGGYTAIATYALLAAGESPQDPRIQAAVNYLLRAPITSVYALGLRCNVWALLPQTPEIRRAALLDAQHLLAAVKKKGEARGLYDYTLNTGDRYDHSVSQYGVLGIWACVQMNLEIPLGYWQEVDAAWRRHQHPNGAWSYYARPQEDHPPNAAMTAAGIATLFITQEYLHPAAGVNCKGNLTDPHIERGMQWMSVLFAETMKEPTYYTLYGIERIGVASGHKYFGTHNWYEAGADYLVREKKGKWESVPDTAFAVLFLVRGRAPVMMNKLQYTISERGRTRVGSWNQRPRDVANITRWAGRQVEKDLNWQIVNLSAGVEEFHDAPILYISGKEALALTEAEEAKLKQYVEQGGIIVANADCGSSAFSGSIRRLGSRLFPQAEPWRLLPDEHVIYTGQQFPRAGWKSKPSVLGLSNGVRELILLFGSDDPAKRWQIQSFVAPDSAPLAQVMGNIFLYAVEKQNLRFKGESHLVKRESGKKPARTIRVARLQHAGNWDPEPEGWPRLATIMHNRHATTLAAHPVKLGAGRLSREFQAAHLTGTGDLALDDSAREELKRYVEEGGTLIIDAAGGKEAFALSAEAELQRIFPEAKEALDSPLSREHAVYSTGDVIEQVGYRAYARVTSPALRLRGLEVEGRTRVFFSREDLSVGLVGHSIDGINGYAPTAVDGGDGKRRAGASEIMANILLYAAGVEAR